MGPRQLYGDFRLENRVIGPVPWAEGPTSPRPGGVPQDSGLTLVLFGVGGEADAAIPQGEAERVGEEGLDLAASFWGFKGWMTVQLRETLGKF